MRKWERKEEERHELGRGNAKERRDKEEEMGELGKGKDGNKKE